VKRALASRPAALSPALLLAAALACALPGAASAVQVVPNQAQGRPRLSVDVWINKEEGGVYQPGENMRVFFRSSAEAYVLVYNIDTEGYIHLVYPYGPADPSRVEGGATYQIPARHDPYELVADGPPGMEFVVAVASPVPFQNLPWYLSIGSDAIPPSEDEGPPPDDLQSGVIVGDPYVGMGRINQLIVPPGYEKASATNETFFYIGRPVEYPRYVCADCHYPGFIFDPYIGVCPVVSIQVDATWVRYTPVPVPVLRPRYYYTVRPNAPDRYRAWKERWSTLDGTPELRTKFVAGRNPRTVRPEASRPRPSASQGDLRNVQRRDKPGRLWMGRDQVLRLWEQQTKQYREGTNPGNGGNKRQRGGEQSQGGGNRGQGGGDRGSKQGQGQSGDQGQTHERGSKGGGSEKPPPASKGGDHEKSPPPSKGGDNDKSSPPPKGNDNQGNGHNRGNGNGKGH
jgi:Domain of unknown function (DUF4384)